MASITSLMANGSSTSSIYGNRNVLSGLASGMDTESMIENAVSGIKSKITSLLQKRTKIEWQQEAYRSIIDKAVNLNNKYTSYTSKTNLLSSSFFTNAVNTAALGTYANKVTASGKSTSDIRINAVKQMAAAASYTVSGLGGVSGGEIMGIKGGKALDIGGDIPVSTVAGSLAFKYGGTNGTTFTIEFGELENLDEIEVLDEDGNAVEDPSNTQKLAQAIKNKLSEVTYTYTKNGFQETTTADKAIHVEVDPVDGISFSDGLDNGNQVTVSALGGDIGDTLGISEDDTGIRRIMIESGPLAKNTPVREYLEDKTLSMTFNGTTKTIDMSKVIENSKVTYDDPAGTDPNEKFVQALQDELDNAFGAGKITASRRDDGRLSFTPNGKGDVLTLGGTALEAMGFESGDANYINTGKKLTDILGDRADSIFSQANRLKGEGGVTEKTSPNGTTYYVDSKGSYVDKDGYRIDADGKAIYDFEINGTHINVTEDTTLESLMNSINSNADAGVKVSYSKLTNEFKFTASQTGASGKIEFGKLGSALFGDTSAAENAPVGGGTTAAELLGADYDYGNQFANFTVNVAGENFSIHVDENSTIDSIVHDLNDMISTVGDLADERFKGVQASFDAASGSIVFQDADGKAVEASAGNGAAKDLFGKLEDAVPKSTYTKGQDAIMDVEINGVRFENLTRSSNSFDLDGLTVNVKGTFNEDGSNIDKDGNAIEPITFETTTDADKIVDAIRSFVEDYNEMVTELKSAYSTLPAQQSNGSRYEPLTAEQEDGMTESEIKAYEEKAKQGVLFGDSTLSRFYSKLLSSITPGGADGQALREIGIGTSYSDGLTTLSLDEDKLRNTLESNPDKVKNAFTKTKEGGSSSDGLMQTMQNTLNTYVKTTGEPKGALIVHAGSIKAPTSLNSNSLLTQMNNIDTQIERWQDKMSNQIDRYTTQFSRLEQLIAQMNSQYSAMSGLMGGAEGY